MIAQSYSSKIRFLKTISKGLVEKNSCLKSKPFFAVVFKHRIDSTKRTKEEYKVLEADK